MWRMKQTQTLVLKVTPDLKEALTAAAQHSSTPWVRMTASEYVRRAIIEKLEREAATNPWMEAK
jgi:uncharacterized protein (DUF1778 family)